jgi:ribonucleotide reductase alpha subunit
VHQKPPSTARWFNCGFEKAPQCSACFINSVDDTMESILGLAKTEGMLFKFGSGEQPLGIRRQELLAAVPASGPVSFMKGFDAFAGVIKSAARPARREDGYPQRRASGHPRVHQLQGRGREKAWR